MLTPSGGSGVPAFLVGPEDAVVPPSPAPPWTGTTHRRQISTVRCVRRPAARESRTDIRPAPLHHPSGPPKVSTAALAGATFAETGLYWLCRWLAVGWCSSSVSWFVADAELDHDA